MHASFERLPTADLVFAGAQINSPDPERLVRFYANVFGGKRLPDAGSQTLHWQTPGYASGGPVLTVQASRPDRVHRSLRANDGGYAHLCFEAEDVGGLLRRLQDHGGRLVSSLPKPHRQPGIYATDPDGNLVEIHLPLPLHMTPTAVLRTLVTLLRIKLGWAPAPDGLVRFIHVNVVVPDWQTTVDFYQRGLGAVPYGRLRDYRGPYVGQLTGISGATVAGRHVALPGYGAGGPTFEVFTYNNTPARAPRTLDDAGILVADFHARDMAAATRRLQQAGATQVHGAQVQGAQHASGTVLLQDPNGNFLRLRPL